MQKWKDLRNFMERLKQININHIEKVFKELSNKDISVLGISLISELKFMKATLKSLKKEIKDRGVIVVMPQGNYDIERANPAIASYNTMVKNYNSTIKQIHELLSACNVDYTDDFDTDDLLE